MNDPETLLELIHGRDAKATALSAPGREALSFGALQARIDQVATALSGAGIGRGDRVALVLPNGPELALALLGTAAAAVAAPLNPAYRRKEFDFYLADLRASALIVEADSKSPALAAANAKGLKVLALKPEAGGPAGAFDLEGPHARRRAERRPPAREDIALLLHTSGTTSTPKLVPLRQGNLCVSAQNVRKTLELGAGDRCLNLMPLFHVHGLVGALLASLAAGASVTCAPGFNALKFFAWLEEAGANWYTAVPAMHQAILVRAERARKRTRRTSLKFVRSSSAPLARGTMAELENALEVPVIDSYGMTEATHQITSNPLPPGKRKPGSVGLPAGCEVALMGPGGRLLGPGDAGEVVVRGENVMAGYEHNPEADAQSFANGWFRTGDEGTLDAEGYLTLAGRLKEIVNRGGEKISPQEVDEVLADHPAVAQAVAFAIPHPTLGQDIAAAVVLRKGAESDSEAIRAFAAERLARFKVPRRVVIVDRIPSSPTGKLQRAKLPKALGFET